jgi:hypothetical protein
MSPTHRMPAGPLAPRRAAATEARAALAAARCAARLAGTANGDAALREVLCVLLQELGCVERALERLGI